MRDSISMDSLRQAYGLPVRDRAGEKIGSVDEVFYDEASREPEWLGVSTGLLGLRRVVVPIAGTSMVADGLAVDYDKDVVDAAPGVEGDEIDQETERALHAHYGLADPGHAPSPARVADEDRSTST